MEFTHPWAFAFALLAIPVVMLAWRRRRASYTVATALPFRARRPTWRLRASRLLPVARGLAIVALAGALAGPHAGDAKAVVPAEGIDVALSLDISSSMTSSIRGSKNRLEAAKEVIREFIKGRQNDRIGLVVFQRDAIPLAPPSLDYKALDRMVADVNTGILPDGTGIGVGLAAAVNLLRDSTAATRVVILLTDGQHNAESIKPIDAAQLAEALRVRVYTIGLVSEGRSGGAEVDEELLTKIAESSGGRYYSAGNKDDLAKIYEEIGDLEKSRVGREHFERFTEMEGILTGLAALLIAAEIGLRATWLRSIPG